MKNQARTTDCLARALEITFERKAMTNTSLLTVFLPVSRGIIMLGLGLSLTSADFTRVARYPKPVMIALACQFLLLPLLCFLLVTSIAIEPALAVGMMLLAASPGGTTANLYSHLAHGDVALNITLTAVSSCLAIITMPLIVNFSLAHFMAGDQALPLQFSKVLQVFAIVLGPVFIGMVLRQRSPAFAARMQKPVKIASVLLLLLIVAMAVIKDWQTMIAYAPVVGLVALSFNLLSLAVGYCVPLLLKLSQRQAVAIGMEIGIHSGALAIALAMSPALLNNSTMAIPAAIYSIIMFFTAAAFGWWVNYAHGHELTDPTAEAHDRAPITPD